MRALAAVALCAVTVACSSSARPAQAAPESAQPPARPPAARDARSKINSQLLQAIDRKAGRTVPPTLEPPRIDIDARGRALVDVRAEVSDALMERIRALGGEIIGSWPELRSIVARMPLERVVALAEHDAVRFIEPAAEAVTQRKK